MRLPSILASKKGQAFLLGLLTLILKDLIGLDDKTALEVVGLVSTYVLGQGIADHGKEQAKVEAAVPDKPA